MGKPKNANSRGASLPIEMSKDVDTRLERLRPWVPGFSSYIQRLITMDLQYGLLDNDGSPNEIVINRKKGRPPFDLRTLHSGLTALV